MRSARRLTFFGTTHPRQYHSFSQAAEALAWLEKNNGRAYTAFIGMCRGEKTKLHPNDYDFKYLIATRFLNTYRLPYSIYIKVIREEKNLSPVSCYLPNGVGYTESAWVRKKF